MQLFENITEKNKNLLPFDGIVNYYGKVFKKKKASNYFDKLLKNIVWENDIAIIFGKQIEVKRKVAWYGEQKFKYTYSNNTKLALPFTEELLELKESLEQRTNETYNSCLLNLYHSGNEGIAWHSDGEKELKKNGAIASLSFGTERKFVLKHKKTKDTVSIILENGSLLLMKGTTQSNWLHRLPPSKKIFKPRINLTFRTIINYQ